MLMNSNLENDESRLAFCHVKSPVVGPMSLTFARRLKAVMQSVNVTEEEKRPMPKSGLVRDQQCMGLDQLRVCSEMLCHIAQVLLENEKEKAVRAVVLLW